MFLAVFAYLAAFVGNLGVPKSIDTPTSTSVTMAVLINLGLLLLFAAQHSVMARPGFKDVWTRLIPKPLERSTYVLLSCVVTIVLMWQWRSIDAVVWELDGAAATAAWILFGIGWLMVPAVSLMIDHFDLFGTRQVWLYFRGREYRALPFHTPLLYRHVRHPLYLGWALAFWATPRMTAGHALFAGVLTVYMGLAAIVEERDLVAHFGRQYQEYRRRVPMFVPRVFGGSTAAVVSSVDEVREL
jgi:protein-S-isoprenylcysteine O-methyltransferase Ste14